MERADVLELLSDPFGPGFTEQQAEWLARKLPEAFEAMAGDIESAAEEAADAGYDSGYNDGFAIMRERVETILGDFVESIRKAKP